MRTNILVLLIAVSSFLITATNCMGFYQNQLKGQFTQIPCLHIEQTIEKEKIQFLAFNYCLTSRRFLFTMKNQLGVEYQYSSHCIPSGERNHLEKYNQEDFFFGISEDC